MIYKKGRRDLLEWLKKQLIGPASGNASICSIVRSWVSFMLITISRMINPLLAWRRFTCLQAHSSLEIRTNVQAHTTHTTLEKAPGCRSPAFSL